MIDTIVEKSIPISFLSAFMFGLLGILFLLVAPTLVVFAYVISLVLLISSLALIVLMIIRN